MKKVSKVFLASSLTLMMSAQSIAPVNIFGLNDSSPASLTDPKQVANETVTIGKNLLTNPNFDANLDGWETGNGKVFRATNNPGPSGKGHYGIDGADTNPYLKQMVTITEDGTYYAKHYATSNGNSAKFQILKDGKVFKEIAISNDGKYHEYIIEFEAKEGDKIEIGVTMAETNYQYLNGDDFYLGTNKSGEEVSIEIANFDKNGNLISNGDFTDGLESWSTKNVRTASNNPPKYNGLTNDKYHWSTDPSDSYLKKYIQIPEDGDYLFSHWVAATGSNGKFGIKEMNGLTLAEGKIKNGGKYHKETLRFSAKKGDCIEIYVLPDQSKGWTNGDDFFLGLDNQNLISNNGFESNTPDINWDSALIKTDNPFGGDNYSYVDKDNLLSKTVNIQKSGYYDFDVYVNNPAQAQDAKVEFINQMGNIIKEVTVPETSNYDRIFIKNLEVPAGDLTIRFNVSGTTGYSVDEMGLVLNHEETVFANITDFEIDGRILENNIDLYNNKIDMTYIYGDDLSSLEIKKISISEGATASVKAGDRINLSKPFIITVTTKDGQSKDWTVNATYSNRKISMSSSNKQLENFFNWGVNNLDQFVVTDQTGKVDDGKKPDAKYMPSYWAGYFNRTAFYSRDFVHQATGGQIAGLADENFNMFKTFAKGATEARDWYTLWAFNFDGSPYYMDYWNDKQFVKEVPAQFELVEKAWNQYLWSGDERYINDPDLLRFYEKSVTSFVELHDPNENGIAEGKGGLFSGLATYNERSSEWKEELHANGDYTIEAADGIACQYAAYVAYSKILNARGEIEKAQGWTDKATELKRLFNDEWSRVEGYTGDQDAEEFVLERSQKGLYRQGFAMETNYFIPLKEIVDPGKRNDLALQMILDGLGTGIGFAGAPANIESYTYIPEMLYKYNWTEEGWDWIQYIDSIKDKPHQMSFQGLNGDYPEVSFTAISNVVEGMMGVAPNAGEHLIATSPRLAAEIPDATVRYMDIGGQLIHLTHVGNQESKLTNASEEDLTWEARFYGEYDYININGKSYVAKQKEINGETVSYASVTVKPGETLDAKASNETIEVNKDTLAIIIEEAEKITDKELDKVVPAVAKEFKAALKEAKDLLVNDLATQEEVDKSFDRLADAMHKLLFIKGDKKALSDLVNKIEKLNKDDYIVSTWDNLALVVQEAKTVLTNDNALEKEVKDVHEKLIRAFVQLRLKPNKDLLNDLINQADELSGIDYTTLSWQNLQTVLADAKAISANPEVQQTKVDESAENLQNAINGLVKETVSNETEKSDNKETSNAAKTGDNTLVGIYCIAMVAMIGVISLFKKRKQD